MNDNSRGATSEAGTSVGRAYGLTILAALLVLVALRHLFGSVRLEVGAR